jgi:serine/threonine protein kinase
MTPERWQQVEALLQETLDRPERERAAFLNDRCAGDENLKNVTALLVKAHDEAGEFIEQPAVAQDAQILVADLAQRNLGREIGPYKITERLGEGGMGEVYLAHDQRLNRHVALKILPAYFVVDDRRLHRFQTEARAVSALNHPNILTIYDVGQSAGLHFIATEFIAGHTVSELIAGQELNLKEVFAIAVQFLRALSAAHAAGIVHRDIKPENIMRRSDGIVKILDFGIAKLIEQTSPAPAEKTLTTSRAQTEIGVVMGTTGYMSPEQARGLPVDGRTDIWSSGVVLYEMLTNRLPFTGATRMDKIVSILEREPALLFSIDDELPPVLRETKQIVNKALRKDAAERYQSADQLLADLEKLLQKFELADWSGNDGKVGPLTMVREIQANSFVAHQTTIADSVVNTADKKALSRLVISAAALLVIMIVGAVLYRRSHPGPALGTQGTAARQAPVRPYSQMSQAEQFEFLDQQEQRISAMMGEHPAKLNHEALAAIKKQVDYYVARQQSTYRKPGEDPLPVIYERAAPYVPLIARSFAARKIPIMVGIYLPMIESEYKTCFASESGAKGLFQFLPGTARIYGVDPSEMCDATRMTPAAARYLADRMAELGDDSQSMTLVLLSYNHGPEWVRESLRQLRGTENYERNFWTLFANRDKLKDFQEESINYVPRFFAVATIGENPQNFGLQLPPLSTLTDGHTDEKR